MSNYSNNLNCEWLVENPQHINSSIVVLLEDLHVQDDQTCGKDYLQFRLGGSFMKPATSFREAEAPHTLSSSFAQTSGQIRNECRKQSPSRGFFLEHLHHLHPCGLCARLSHRRLRWGASGQVLWTHHSHAPHRGVYPTALGSVPDRRLPGRPGLRSQVPVLW